MAGASYRRLLLDLDISDLSEDSVRRHVAADHLPVRALSQQWAAQESESVSQVVAPVVQNLGRSLKVAHKIVESVGTRLATGDLQPDVRDALAALRLIAEFEVEGGGQAVDECIGAMRAMLDVAREALPPDHLRAFMGRLLRHPIIAQMMAA